MQMIPKWNRSQVSSNPLLLLLRTSRLNHGSLKHSEPTSQLVCSTLLEEKQSPFPLCTKNMRIWNEKSSIDGFQPYLPLSKLFFSSSLPKSPFLPLSLSWHYIHLANLLLSCTNISNHYFPSNLIQYESKKFPQWLTAPFIGFLSKILHYFIPSSSSSSSIPFYSWGCYLFPPPSKHVGIREMDHYSVSFSLS